MLKKTATYGSRHRQSIWSKIFDGIRNKGLNWVLQIILNVIIDYWFEIRYGLDTSQPVKLDNLDIKSNNKSRGIYYRPTRVRPLIKLITALKLPADSVFVDLGCGKGRTLLLAAAYGFKKIVGVEFSSELCEYAKQNIAIFRKKVQIDADIEVIESDVCDYEIKDNENVFFLFHPFDDVVMDKVLRNMENSFKQNNRKIWIIYNYPVCRGVIEKQANFVNSGEYTFGNTEFAVYLRSA
jgi:SAM-dependent methyltransferase